MSHLSRLVLASSLILFAAGCGSGGADGSGGGGGTATGGSDGTGGSPGTGGSGGTGGKLGTGGSAGTGGAAGTGGTGGSGNTGGSAGTGGVAGTGGAGTGGGGNTGGTGGNRDGGTDGPVDAGGGGGASGSLDQCFANLPPFPGRYQIATKTSADGTMRVRVALMVEPGGVGTSGTVPWKLVRFGIERGTLSACVTAPNQLVYTGSLHNCSDKAAAGVTGGTYLLNAPDRASTTISAAGAGAFPATTFTNTACKSSDGNACGSGGPCR
ncbi:MAG TPA: hypothetical protein VN914_03590 [Polyangia bacterium]|nr:hypothetical protein [Polyangia bacterium]